jgi:hypothetical protein
MELVDCLHRRWRRNETMGEDRSPTLSEATEFMEVPFRGSITGVVRALPEVRTATVIRAGSVVQTASGGR